MIGILAMQGIICLYLLIFTGILESLQINNKLLRLLVLLNCMDGIIFVDQMVTDYEPSMIEQSWNLRWREELRMPSKPGLLKLSMSFINTISHYWLLRVTNKIIH